MIVVDLKDESAQSDSADMTSPGAVAGRLASFLFTQPMPALGPDDIYIWPDVRGFANLDFEAGNRDRLVKNGRAAADSILRKVACLPRRPAPAVPRLPTRLGGWEVVNGDARDSETMGRVFGLVRGQRLDPSALEAQLSDVSNLETFREVWLGPVGGADTIAFRAQMTPPRAE